MANGIINEDYLNMPDENYNKINHPAVAAKYVKTYYFDTYEEAAVYNVYKKNFDTSNFGSADLLKKL